MNNNFPVGTLLKSKLFGINRVLLVIESYPNNAKVYCLVTKLNSFLMRKTFILNNTTLSDSYDIIC